MKMAAKAPLATMAVLAAVLLMICGCTRKDIIELPKPPEPVIPPTGLLDGSLTISDVADMPSPVPFDRVAVSLVGFDWGVIATVETPFTDGRATLTLPSNIHYEQLCKGARDSYNDYEGYWPAEGISVREVRVAGFEGNNIVAYSGEIAVGRLYLTDWDGSPLDTTNPAANPDRWHIYYVYHDRPVNLSGHNMVRRDDMRRSFLYAASFKTGWNAYANVTYYADEPGATPPPSLCTTDIPESLKLRWRFEVW